MKLQSCSAAAKNCRDGTFQGPTPGGKGSVLMGRCIVQVDQQHITGGAVNTKIVCVKPLMHAAANPRR